MSKGCDTCGPLSRHRGVATIEFVVVTPVLLLLILGIAEIGRACVQYAALASSVRNSVRHVAGEAYAGSTGVIAVTPALQTQGKNLVAYGKIVAGTPLLPGLSPSQVTVANAGGGNVSVTAVYPYVPIVGTTLPTFGLSETPISLVFNMTIVSTMRALP
jgi:Flp pilus assembly protein TadG